MKLKTLKDLKATSKNPMWNLGYEECMINSRQESIKDIKFLESLSKGSDEVVKGLSAKESDKLEKEGFCLFDACGAYDNSNVIRYIKWKFDITEEDLK